MFSIELRNEILRLNSLYRQGKPEVSDAEYDSLVEQLRAISPDDDFFKSGVAEKATDRMQKLPLPMFSLEKIKTFKEFLAWVDRMARAGCKNLVITPKYDGISLLVGELSQAAWTRGDGVQGQRSDAHFARMKNGELEQPVFEYTWGEAICSKKDFESVKGEYKNARNMVAGLFNSPMGANTEQIGAVTFVRYGIDSDENKSVQLDYLNGRYQYTTPYRLMQIENILMYDEHDVLDMLDELYREWKLTYQIDGLVIEVNENSVRKKLGRKPNGNPDYAIAFKREEWLQSYTTTVEKVEWNVSKDGCLCPVVCVKPVEMESATVSKVTGYNAKYIVENHIHPGAEIEITRSGQVIPKHIRTVKWNDFAFSKWFVDNASYCPSCGTLMQYDENSVNLVCPEKGCEQRRISEIVYFFKTLGVEGFSEPTIRTLYDRGYTTLDKILGATIPALQEIFGKVRGMNVFSAISKSIREEQPLSRIMTALNVFGGKIAESIAHKIICEIGDPHTYMKTRTYNTAIEGVSEIDGVGKISAQAFWDGWGRYGAMLKFDFDGFPYEVVIDHKEESVQAAENQLVVCMTGFRDSLLEEVLKAQGHRVVNGITRDCNVLVVADPSSQSSKSQKAREKGIRIVDRKTFEQEIGCL